ncbi:MAG: hypothetical protein NTY35_03135 [Planctomycetota bacterium]|nr:hypothetical protein [Planctomycetota bacterium]
MKLLLPILPVLMLSLAPLARAQESVPVPPPTQSGDVRLEAALDELEQMVLLRGGTRYDFNRLRALLVERASAATGSFFPACKVRGRFLAAVDALEARAKRYQLHAEDVVEMKIDVLEARLDAAVGELIEKAAARGATREQFQRAKDLIVARARMTASEIDSETVRERLTAAVEEIEEMARFAVLERIHFQRYWAQIVEHRLERATVRLNNRLKYGTATRADYQRIQDLMLDRAQIAIDTPPEACP